MGKFLILHDARAVRVLQHEKFLKKRAALMDWATFGIFFGTTSLSFDEGTQCVFTTFFATS